MWMQGLSLASMQTFKHPARPDAALTIYKSLIFKGQLNTSVNNCTAVIDIRRVHHFHSLNAMVLGLAVVFACSI